MNAAPATRVLVAEDNDFSLQLVLQQLEMLGCEAEGAADGEAAFRAWRSGGFGLVLTDLQMPHCDGYGLAARIRAEEDGATVIVGLTAGAGADEAEKCRAAGMDDCITKPASLASLRAYLARGQAAAAARSASS